MTIDKVIEFWRREPFSPFKIRASDGRVYTVDHPGFLMRSRDNKSITFATDYNREVMIDMARVVSLEMVNRL